MPKYSIPKGFRDFPPEVMILRKKVLSIVEETFKKYGYDPIETPALEYWETLKGKYGEEAENKLLYRFKDPWSNKWYALRYDLTVPLARFLSHHAVPLPFRRYHISRVWRHENPQRGRYREFWQCDVDIVGSPYPEADAEIINVVSEALKSIGFKNFAVKINDRRLLAGIFEESLNIKNVHEVYRVIDKLDKIGLEEVKQELLKRGYKEELIEKIIEIISIRGSPEKVISEVGSSYERNIKVLKAIDHLRQMLDLIDPSINVKLELSLVRGLNYYTGPIFEVVIEEANIGSVAGGGRYDNLMEIYAKKFIPATGGSIGIERVIDAGIELGIFKLSERTYTKVYILTMYFNQELYKYALNIAKMLRENKITVQLDVMRRKEQAQRRYVAKKDIPIIVFIGEKELKNGTLTIYHREKGERYVLKLKEAINRIKAMLRDES